MKFLKNEQQRNRILLIGGGVILVLFFVWLLGHAQKPSSPIKKENPWEETGGEDLYKQKWMTEAQSELEAVKERQKALEQKQEKTQQTLEQILKALQALKKEKEVAEKEELPKPQKSQTQMGANVPPQTQPLIPPPQNFQPHVIRDVVEVKNFEPEKETEATSEKGQKEKNAFRIVLPPGSFVPAVLLSGVDAPTMGQGVAKEYPVLLELKDYAFLPNNWRIDVKKCFAVGWARGDLASERAYIRIDRLSCVTKSGKALVAKGSAFAAVYGEDGKVGLLGRVVAKEGALIARSVVAGFLEGVSQILQQSATVVNISPVGGTTTQTLKPSEATRYALFGGASKAAEILAKEYERLIKLTFPVIEIPAGRKVDVVFYDMPEFKVLDLIPKTPK